MIIILWYQTNPSVSQRDWVKQYMSPTSVSHYPYTLHQFNFCPVYRGQWVWFINAVGYFNKDILKQLLKSVIWKSYREKFDKIYRKSRVIKYLFQ